MERNSTINPPVIQVQSRDPGDEPVSRILLDHVSTYPEGTTCPHPNNGDNACPNELDKSYYNSTNPFNHSLPLLRPFYEQSNQEHIVMTNVQTKTDPTMTAFEQALSKMTLAFTETFKTLNKPNHRPQPQVTFHGFTHDDPLYFIKTLENYFTCESEVDRVNVAASLLRGDAELWFQAYKCLNLSWVSFREQFLNHFNDISVTASATSSLYGETQDQKELVSVFIARKVALFSRLDPTKSDHLRAAIILELLRPEIRSRIRRHGAQMSCETLSTLASAVERDFNEELKLFTQTVPINKHPHSAVNQPNSGPPSPCKYCQGWHYHKDCPRNPYTSKNGQQAGRGLNSRPARTDSQHQQQSTQYGANWRTERSTLQRQ